MIAVFIGPPGSGKGTQAQLAVNEFKLTHLSSGELLRSEINADTEIGKQALEYVRKGELVPNSIIVKMILNALPEDSNMILDGFPRELEQARALDEALTSHSTKVDVAVLFKVSEEEVVERLSQRRHCVSCNALYNSSSHAPKKEDVCDACGMQLVSREDDQPAVIRQRFVVYNEQTTPLADYYRKQGVLTEVNASDTIENVYGSVSRAIKERF